MRKVYPTHTWPMRIEYHRCNKCGSIVESRKGYERRWNQYEKDLICPACGHRFTAVRDKVFQSMEVKYGE